VITQMDQRRHGQVVAAATVTSPAPVHARPIAMMCTIRAAAPEAGSVVVC
jgi:hypothetical protein